MRKDTETTPPDLQGRLDTVNLFDICQFLMINRRTGALTTNSRGDTHKITFLEGQIQDAVGPSFKHGIEALHPALALQTGEFSFHECSVPPVDTFQESTDSLLLDAIRLMDERGEGGNGSTELEDRQKRAQELAHLLGKHEPGNTSTDASSPLEDWIRILKQWGARLHFNPRGEIWLESKVSNIHRQEHDPEFREKMLEKLLGARKDHLLEGGEGLVETELGELWWCRSEYGSSLLSLGFVQRCYPTLGELGINSDDLENLDTSVITVHSPSRLDTSRLVGSLFQDGEAFGRNAGTLLSPWATARPEMRKGPTLWIPGATSKDLSLMLKQAASFDNPILAIEPPINPSSDILNQLIRSGWRILMGRTGTTGSEKSSDNGVDCDFEVSNLAFESLENHPNQYRLVSFPHAA